MATLKLSLKRVNELSTKEFHETFINVVECWSEAAVYVSAISPFNSFELLIKSFERYLEQLNLETKVKILRLHPDLAGKLAESGGLTVESTMEQSSAGLDTLTPENKEKLTDLNETYKAKFGFPFVICVRENKLDTIFKSLTQRLENSELEEIAQGIEEVKKICKLRILEIIDSN